MVFFLKEYGSYEHWVFHALLRDPLRKLPLGNLVAKKFKNMLKTDIETYILLVKYSDVVGWRGYVRKLPLGNLVAKMFKNMLKNDIQTYILFKKYSDVVGWRGYVVDPG